MPYKYIGRTTDWKGKTLWEILGNLKNFGVGRYVARNIFNTRYKEPCYFKILKVEALPNETKPLCVRKVIALVESVFRGVKAKRYIQMESATYKSDFFLIPKHKEAEFCKMIEKPPRLLPVNLEYPPLLKEIIQRRHEARGLTFDEEQLKIKIKYTFSGAFKNYEIRPVTEIGTGKLGIGKSLAPRLYEIPKESEDITAPVSEKTNSSEATTA